MEMRGRKFLMAEFDVDEEYAKPIREAFAHDSQVQVKVVNLVKKENACCLIPGSCFDSEICIIAPTITLMNHPLAKRDFVRSIKPFENEMVIVTEYLLIERVTDWINVPIRDYYRIVEISS